MKRNDPITARDLAREMGVELPPMLAWLRANGHNALNGSYLLGGVSEDQVRAHLDELLAQDAEWRANDPHKMPPRPGRPSSDGSSLGGRQR